MNMPAIERLISQIHGHLDRIEAKTAATLSLVEEIHQYFFPPKPPKEGDA